MQTRCYVILVMIALLALGASDATGNNILHQMNYQGQLADSSGNPLDTTIDMDFSIYHDLTGGTAIWTEDQDDVDVIGGLFNLSLGSVTAIPDSVFMDTSLYLGITIGGDSELSPRSAIASAAFSYGTGAIDGATGGAIEGDLEISSKVTIGYDHVNWGDYSFVVGYDNYVNSDYATVVGGRYNQATGDDAFVAGSFNHATNSYASVGGGESNTASGINSVISGGHNSTASANNSTICGGSNNIASEIATSIGGGAEDTASGEYSTVPGGFGNRADGKFSFASGRYAKAMHDGAFVWADTNTADFASSAANQFNIRASGGVRIYTNSALTAGVTMASGASAWASVSDSTRKRIDQVVDGAEILESLAQMPIYLWSYKAQDENVKHVGPMAQDFYSSFGLGDDNLTISTIDPDGIALAAIKELYLKTQEIDNLKHELQDLRQTVEILLSQQNATSRGNSELAVNK